MITNFETQTADLTAEEMKLVPAFVAGLKTKIGKKNAITNKKIREAFESDPNWSVKIPDTRIRKIINHIRVNALVPCLCASSSGYYVAANKEEADEYLSSLRERVASQSYLLHKLENQTNKQF